MSDTRSKPFHSTADAARSMGPAPEGRLALPVFRHGSLDVEFYAPRDIDKQQPHTRDEVYVVVSGSGYFFDGTAKEAVSAGSFIFVPAGQTHRFEDFSQDFAVWVMFYGPEGGEAAA